MTEIVKINREDPDPVLKEAALRVKEGKIIVFPTDTLYGIGVDIYNDRAIDRVFLIKKRDSGSPILILIEKPSDLFPLVKKVPPAGRELIDRFWPGPLTLIFDASESLSPRLTGNTGKIGIRCPDSRLVQRLLSFLKSPITATSANRSHEPPCQNASEAEKYFGNQVDLILDGGTLVSEPSTVADVTGGTIKIIRQGKIKIENHT
ncbi:MAG: threonylcarbamoyl-AMP synthase [Nitrospirae bacterium]|nr:threonylcarbamoyl-AMP synthase [Nitrospirota bacterium]